MYHRDHAGYDFGANDKELTTWRLQAWAKTDEEGKFEFRTIRPAPDHLGREGGHFHFTTVSSEFGKQWMQKIYFLDDHKISNHEKQRSAAQGKFSWLKEVKTLDGIQHIDVAFKLKQQADFL
jgi:protocatechuate 3,4-dioxygenase beta subunit